MARLFLISRLGKEGSSIPTWEALKALVKKGKVRAIGVSNFSITELRDLLPYAQDVPIACNQIECRFSSIVVSRDGGAMYLLNV